MSQPLGPGENLKEKVRKKFNRGNKFIKENRREQRSGNFLFPRGNKRLENKTTTHLGLENPKEIWRKTFIPARARSQNAAGR